MWKLSDHKLNRAALFILFSHRHSFHMFVKTGGGEAKRPGGRRPVRCSSAAGRANFDHLDFSAMGILILFSEMDFHTKSAGLTLELHACTYISEIILLSIQKFQKKKNTFS